VVEHLFSKCETLSSNPRTAKKEEDDILGKLADEKLPPFNCE
jgi:hypothetical protein